MTERSDMRLGCQVAHTWRTSKDISLGSDPAVGWSELLENLDNSARLGRHAGPGGWNDLGERPETGRCRRPPAAQLLAGRSCPHSPELDRSARLGRHAGPVGARAPAGMLKGGLPGSKALSLGQQPPICFAHAEHDPRHWISKFCEHCAMC